jgi:hypothetical protein
VTAIQRWYFYAEGEHKCTDLVPESARWCRHRDVEELERLVIGYLSKIADQRCVNENLRSELLRHIDRKEFLEKQLRQMDLEQQTFREKYARMEAAKDHAQARYDMLMQRTRVAEDDASRQRFPDTTGR